MAKRHRPQTDEGKAFARSIAAQKAAETRRLNAETGQVEHEDHGGGPRFLVVAAKFRGGFSYDFQSEPDLDAVILRIECQLRSEFDPDFDDVYADQPRFLSESGDVAIFQDGRLVAILRRNGDKFDVTRSDA